MIKVGESWLLEEWRDLPGMLPHKYNLFQR